MTKYMNKQNGKVMEILKQDTEKGTMIIQFTDGKTSSITTGTFKRWYKAFEVPETVETLDVDTEEGLTEDEAVEQAVVDPDTAYVAEVMEQKKELGIECPEITSYEEVAGDGTPLAQVGKEIAEQAKQKAAKAAKTVKKESVSQDQILQNRNAARDLLNQLGFTVLEYEKIPGFFVVKIGKKRVIELKVGRSIAIRFKTEDRDVVSVTEGKVLQNYCLPCNATKLTQEQIKEILIKLKNKYLKLTKEEN